jgi:hypothetical protein
MFKIGPRPPSILRLRAICQAEKLRKKDDLTRRHRFVSIYATWLLVQTPVTADQVTIASIVLGIAGALALAAPGLGWGILGCLLLYVSFLFDQVDGEVARFRKRSSLRGVYLDELRHLVIYAAPVFALGFDASRAVEADWPLGVSFVAGLGLTLARIEERLPALIFGERAAKLRRDGTTEHTGGTEDDGKTSPPSSVPSVASVVSRWLVEATSECYQILAHQVLILCWLLVAVVFDRGFGTSWVQALFLLGLALATCGALVASVASRLKPGRLEAEVRARAQEIA